MRKLLLLSALCIFSSVAFTQQPFAPPGAVWYYDIIFMSYGGFIKIEAKHDTVIHGITCRKLELNLYKWFTIGPGQVGFNLSQMDPKYVYQSGDTIYWLTGNHFQVLYNFNSIPGSQWTVTDSMAWGMGQGDCDSLSIVLVDSTGNEIINGENLRYLTVRADLGSPAGFYGRIYERLGGLHMLFPEYAHCDSGIIIDSPMYKLHCYQDSSFQLYKTDTLDCEWWWILSNKDFSADATMFSIYPNPASDNLLIAARIGYDSFTIINSLGQVQIEHTGNAIAGVTKLDIHTLPPGSYILRIVNDTGTFIRRFSKL